MRNKTAGSLAILTVSLLLPVQRVAAQHEMVLHSFGSNSKDGAYPAGSLIFDAAGNLYGTTLSGGVNGLGTVFELSPKTDGVWSLNVLHTFPVSLKDGDTPNACVIFDASGNLYGTTSSGGAYDAGTVFELKPSARGWRETIIHNFNPNGIDGSVPYSGLVFDAIGNLYGTTYSGGAYGGGIVFELMPKGGGTWKEEVLHTFGSSITDGFAPYAGLIFDAAGNLYGTTISGGAYGGGTAFELTPTPGGNWIENTLHSFTSNTGTDGFNPYGGLILDAAGSIYGTTVYGTAQFKFYYDGIVFRLTPAADGSWDEQILYTFNGRSATGFYPMGGVIFDGAGNLYGTTYTGDLNVAGAVFELKPAPDGNWTEDTLYTFAYASKQGADPHASLIRDASGNLYGTTYVGGGYDQGTVFEITP